MTLYRGRLLAACCLLLPGIAGAADIEDQARAAEARHARSVTVYVDSTWGNRTNGAARALNHAHDAFAAHGYLLVDVAPYLENGDLQGFFVSYVRERATEGTAGPPPAR